MKWADDFVRSNKFRWFTESDGKEAIQTYPKDDLLMKIREPQAIGLNRRLQYFQLLEDDFLDASDVLQLVLQCQ